MGLIVAFVITAAITPAVARLAHRLDIVDRPGPLKLQRAPIPYLGGVAVALGLVGPVAVVWPRALIPLALALGLGLADDRFSLPVSVRLPIEIGIGVAVASVVPGATVASGIAIVAVAVLLLNATNLLDGLDALAGSVVAIGALGFAAISSTQPAGLALALAGALLGFLVWNRPPARIYLGDAGSYLLGTALAMLLAAMLVDNDLGVPQASAALLFVAAPVADTVVAIVRRFRAGQPLAQGDRGHIYDQLLASGVSGPRVTFVFALAQALLVSVGLAASAFPDAVAVAVTAGVIVVTGVTLLVAFTTPAGTWADDSPIIDVLGTSVQVRVPDALRPELETTMAGLITAVPARRVLALEPSNGGEALRLLDDGEVVLDGIDPAVGVATVVWHLNGVAGSAPGHVVIHAGCVAWQGRAVLLPGRSGAGKSELTAACIADGFAYLSDEHGAVDLATGLLTPYAKPLSLRAGLVAPATLGASTSAPNTAPAAIVFPHYSQGAPFTATKLTPALTLLALCAHAHRVDAEGFLWLAGLAQVCPAWDVTYGSSASGVAAVHSALDDSSPTPRLRAEPARPSTTGPEGVEVLVVQLGDVIVIFQPSTGLVHHLNQSAAFIWSHGHHAAPDVLVREVQAAAPPGALSADDVLATIEWLTHEGLLATTDRPDAGATDSSGGEPDGPVVDP